MKRFHDISGLTAADRGAAVALGNFDGVHLGHQSVLALAHAAAAELSAPFGVVSFEPHPRSFFAPGAPPFRLMTADARAHQMQALGVASIYGVGQVTLGIAADSKAGITLYMKFGFGAEVVVGLPVVANVSVLYMVEIERGARGHHDSD